MNKHLDKFKENGVNLELSSVEDGVSIYSGGHTNSVVFGADSNTITIFSNLNDHIDDEVALANYSITYLLSAKSSAEILTDEISKEDLPMFIMVVIEQTKNAAKYGRVTGKFDDLNYSIIVTNGLTVLDLYKDA